MFKSKNISPQKLAAFNALILSCINSLFSLLLHSKWYIALIIFIVSFLVSYALIIATLQYFIYRKIKLIYKLIYQTKANKKEAFFYKKILPQRSIDKVQEDVSKWALKKSSQIELLQKNEQFRKEFLSNLAHELRTPIFTIDGYIQTLLGGALEDKAVNKKFLNGAAKGMERLIQLTEDLDQITRLESGQSQLEKSNFQIQELIKDIFEEMELIAQQKNISLSFKKGTENSLQVFADRQKIKQVLVNLIENAIKYGNLNGQLIAGCYTIDDEHAYIEISDNGPGIDSIHLPRVFERFYRVDSNRSRELGGTGLGLAIVKHIIEAHGQTVNVRSKVGVGSSFGFMLQLAKT